MSVEDSTVRPARRPTRHKHGRTFGSNLRDARRLGGVSQDDLGRRSGVDRTAISTYERGRREPNLKTIVKLARALGVAPADLLRGLR